MLKPSKPSLSALMAAQPATKAKRATKSAPAVPAPIESHDRPAEMVRALFVRRFVTAYLKDMNAAAALRTVRPNVSKAASRPGAHELLQADDVRAELLRQLQGLSKRADIDEEWVYRFWRAMAEANIFDYVKIGKEGKVTEFRLDPDHLTREQQLMVRELKFDAKTGKVTHIKLVDLEGTVANVAKAKKLFSLLDDTGLKDLVKDISERMQAASKRLPRTFDHDTGEEV